METRSDEPTADALLRDLDRLTGRPCHDCARAICGHEAVASIVLGLKAGPRCLGCLAAGLQRVPTDLLDQVVTYVQRRDCYRQAWAAAGEREGQAYTHLSTTKASSSHAPVLSTQHSALSTQFWDAGDMACGELVMHLRNRLLALPPGGVLRLTATDPAGPEDLPAWCRLTGHALLDATPPVYHIRRKET